MVLVPMFFLVAFAVVLATAVVTGCWVAGEIVYSLLRHPLVVSALLVVAIGLLSVCSRYSESRKAKP